MATSTANNAPWWEQEGFEAIRVNPNDTPQQWREAALNWEVKKAKVMFKGRKVDPNTGEAIYQTSTLDDRFVIYRDDTLGYLTTDASNRYHVHTIDKLCEAMYLVCQQGGYQMNTIGSLKGGRKIWFMAKTEADVNIAGERFNRNVVMGTSYDQTEQSFAFCSDVAIVCNNTRSYAIETADEIYRVSHRNQYVPSKVVGDLSKVVEAQETMRDQMFTLTDREFSPDEIEKFFKNVARELPVPTLLKNEPEKHVQTIAQQIADSYLYAPGGIKDINRIESRVGTMHGATQAVIHYVDFKMLTTLTGKSKTNRFNRAFFGDGAKLKTKAFNMSLQQVA